MYSLKFCLHLHGEFAWSFGCICMVDWLEFGWSLVGFTWWRLLIVWFLGGCFVLWQFCEVNFTTHLLESCGFGVFFVKVWMEDPRTDIEYVVRGLVEKPTLRRQAAVLHKYFTPDVQFYHFYINTNGGLRDLIAIYQFAELAINYQGVVFHRIIYDDTQNCMALEMTVDTRPWLSLGATVSLKFNTLLQLEDWRVEVGFIMTNSNAI